MTSHSPPSQQPSHFVGRGQELRSYQDAVGKLANGPLSHVIYNVYALTGMGKTWFGYELFRRLESEQMCDCVWLSFEPDHAYLPPAAHNLKVTTATAGLRAIWLRSPLANSLDELELDPAFEISAVWQGTPVLPPPTDSAQSRRPFVLILDALNRLETYAANRDDTEAWEQLQAQIIRPLAEQSGVLVLCLSQVPLRWSFWELREQCRPEQLKQLSRQETEDILAQYQLQEQSDIVYELTLGHPASISYIIQRYFASSSEPLTDVPNVQYKEIKQQFEHLEPYDRQLIENLGLLRRVEVQTIQHILRTLPLGLPSEMHLIHKALSKYLEQGLMVCHPGYLPFSFTPLVRRVVESDLQQGDQIDLFAGICRALHEWYYGELQSKPITNRKYFVDWMYFSLQDLRQSLIGSTGEEQREAHIRAWVAKFQEYWTNYGDEETRKHIRNDDFIQSALVTSGVQNRIERIFRNYQPLRKPGYQRSLLQSLLDYLFRDRFPRPIAPEEREVLIFIAQHFDDGFDVPKLQDKLQQLDTIQPTPTNQKLRAYVNLFNEIHAITYDQQSRRFVMDRWLQKFLKNSRRYAEQESEL